MNTVSCTSSGDKREAYNAANINAITPERNLVLIKTKNAAVTQDAWVDIGGTSSS